jgi:hypothetical protein
MVPHRARLKSFFLGASTTAAATVYFADNVTTAATYARASTVATITSYKHGLMVGDWVYINFDSLTDGLYQVATVTDTNTFTVTVADTGAESGTATLYADILAVVKVSTANDVFNLLPGEGILAENGIRVFLENSVPATIYYG